MPDESDHTDFHGLRIGQNLPHKKRRSQDGGREDNNSVKEMIGVGSGIRGGGSSYAHTQGQGESTQVTILPAKT
jgi:hypothetical protein